MVINMVRSTIDIINDMDKELSIKFARKFMKWLDTERVRDRTRKHMQVPALPEMTIAKVCCYLYNSHARDKAMIIFDDHISKRIICIDHCERYCFPEQCKKCQWLLKEKGDRYPSLYKGPDLDDVELERCSEVR